MSRRAGVAGLFTAVGFAVLAGLGTWQWFRLGEKEALIATIAARTHLPPVPLATLLPPAGRATDDMAWRPVSVTGRFDHAHEAHVFTSLARPRNGLSGPGYLVLTPLALQDGGVVLVNRGFVPADRKAADRRAAGQTPGEVTLGGLVRLPEARGRFSNADDPGKNVYYVRDPDAIAAGLGIGPVVPVVIDQTTPAPEGGLPSPGTAQIDIPNNHFGYALTWWSLAIALLVIFGLFARSTRR